MGCSIKWRTHNLFAGLKKNSRMPPLSYNPLRHSASFCGGHPANHVSIFGLTGPAHTSRERCPFITSARIILNEDGTHTHSAKKIAGDPKSRKLRIVCSKCNNEWMSEIQGVTKPILIPFLRGQPTTLSELRQKRLATWIAMTVICAEYLQPASVSIPVTARRCLFLKRIPPDNMRIWIGNFARKNWKADWAHNSLRIAENEGRYP